MFLPGRAWQAVVPGCWCGRPWGSAMGVHRLSGPARPSVQWGHWRLTPQVGDDPLGQESCSEPLKQPGPIELGHMGPSARVPGVLPAAHSPSMLSEPQGWG